MIIENIAEITKKKYQAVIFGTGPAGTSLALDLEKKKIDCLIIESGKNIFSEESQDFYKCQVVGDDYGDMSTTRLRQLGGTSEHWEGNCRPLDEHDFSKWNFKKKELDQFLPEACNILNIKNKFYNKKIDNTLNNISYQQSNVRFSQYYTKINESKYIDFVNNTSLFDIVIENNAITKSTLIHKGKKINFENANLYIIACGGIENNRIMLNLKNKYKNFFSGYPIGHYYMDHPVSTVAKGLIELNTFKKYFKFDKHGGSLINTSDSFTSSVSPTYEFINQEDILNTELMLSINGLTKIQKTDLLKNLQLVAPHFFKNIFSKNSESFKSITISCSPEQDSLKENRIELSKTDTDSFGMPRPVIYWKKSRKMKKTQKILVEQIGKDFIRNNIGRIGALDFLYNQDTYPNSPGIHHMGGTRIGKNSKNSVVNSDLKVHGLNNFYVCGSSVFKSSGHANPTLTIVQLALKLSRHIDQILKTV